MSTVIIYILDQNAGAYSPDTAKNAVRLLISGNDLSS